MYSAMSTSHAHIVCIPQMRCCPVLYKNRMNCSFCVCKQIRRLVMIVGHLTHVQSYAHCQDFCSCTVHLCTQMLCSCLLCLTPEVSGVVLTASCCCAESRQMMFLPRDDTCQRFTALYKQIDFTALAAHAPKESV